MLKSPDVTMEKRGEKKVTKRELDVGRKSYGESRKWEVPHFSLVLRGFPPHLLHPSLGYDSSFFHLHSLLLHSSIPLSVRAQLSLAWFRLILLAFLRPLSSSLTPVFYPRLPILPSRTKEGSVCPTVTGQLHLARWFRKTEKSTLSYKHFQ